ncbi:MAG: response regulator [Microcoleus sp.]
MKKLAILCVDDETIILDSFTEQLRRNLDSACEIEGAQSGDEALEIIEELQADGLEVALVVSDQIMPGMKGYELLRKIHELYPKTLKIMLTGEADAQALGKAINEANLYRYIAKPWDETDLILTVKEALRSYAQEQQLAEQNQELKKLNFQLEQLNTSLEQKVADRTLELQKAALAAEVANKAKSVFLANMSHELRSPLNSILGFAQLLMRSSTLDPKDKDNIEIISRSGEHLLTLINNVLDLSKIEAGRTVLNEINFDLRRLLEDLEQMFRLKAEDKGLQLVFDVPADLPQYVRSDEVKLRQCLINLLNNAIKFTSEGGVSVRVRKHETGSAASNNGATKISGLGNDAAPKNVKLSEIPNSSNFLLLNFEIEDTGAGIPAVEIDKIFEAFTQIKLENRYQEGTGLGLAITRSFVQLMGGKISVKSRQGNGSIFAFDVAVSVVDAADMEIKQQMRREIGLEPNQPRYRILVVDDKSDNRQLLVKLLSPFEFELQEASNGKEAIEIWKAWEPHLIWMDVRMPVMDGREATRKIRQQEAQKQGELTVPRTAIIAITASTFEEERAVILEAGCDDFVRKPFRENIIFEKMAEFIGVRYIYEEEPLQQAANILVEPASEISLIQDLVAMPEEWIDELYEAAQSIDNEKIFQLISQIPAARDSLAQTLKDWATLFRCDRIIDIIESASSEAGNLTVNS